MLPADARAFAEEWIDAWNAHDVERVLTHYAPDILFMSPIAQRRVGNGRVRGIDALASYWRGALKAFPDLKFELETVLMGHDSLTILYRNHLHQRVAEMVEFGPAGKVVQSIACYS